MADSEKICAVYYPDVVIRDKAALATFCLYFDEVQAVPFFPLYEGKKGDIRDFQILVPFPVEGDEISSFLLDNRLLENEVLFYKRDVIDMVIHGASTEGEQLSDLAAIVFGQGHPDMHSIVRLCVIGILAEKRGWIPVGDKSEIPIPVPQEVISSPKARSLDVAEECCRLELPLCLPVSSEDILEVRKNLKDELLAFRMAVQRLSDVLRKERLPDNSSLVDLTREARSVAETTVEPALQDIRTRIELELAKAKVWTRVFGRVLTRVALIGHIYTPPSPGLMCKALEKESKDTEGPWPVEQGESAFIQPGLSFLLELDDIAKQMGSNR